ncbi:hypothetical protein GF323_01190 [Candidatus Woesearchaeota archaeon]|nr:hypothetical protein [Candidatus Woesearchaeota archaeon]
MKKIPYIIPAEEAFNENLIRAKNSMAFFSPITINILAVASISSMAPEKECFPLSIFSTSFNNTVIKVPKEKESTISTI